MGINKQKNNKQIYKKLPKKTALSAFPADERDSHFVRSHACMMALEMLIVHEFRRIQRAVSEADGAEKRRGSGAFQECSRRAHPEE